MSLNNTQHHPPRPPTPWKYFLLHPLHLPIPILLYYTQLYYFNSLQSPSLSLSLSIKSEEDNGRGEADREQEQDVSPYFET